MNPHFEQVKNLFEEGCSPQEITSQLPLSLNTVASICRVLKTEGV